MTGRSPIGPLMAEHREIERLIAVLENEINTMEREHRADVELLGHVVDFVVTYADRCHHGKEEEVYFRHLAEKDLSSDVAEAMDDLINDHRKSRELVRRLESSRVGYASGNEDALGEIISSATGLVKLYPVHIEKEDRHFFRASLPYLDQEERELILDEYEEVELTLLHEHYKDMLGEMERRSENTTVHA